MTEKPSNQKPSGNGKESVELSWESVDQLNTIYANQLFISHFGPEFTLVFGEVVSPLIVSTASVPSQLSVKPVARIVIPFEMMDQFIAAINRNFEKFKATRKAK